LLEFKGESVELTFWLTLKELQRLFNFDQFQNAVLHFLNCLELCETKTSLVGDVVDAAFGFRVLSAGSAHLQTVLARRLLQLLVVRSQLGHLDVHRRTDRRSQVRRAESQETESVVAREFVGSLNRIRTVDHASVYGAQVSAHLHGDDSQVILFVAPDEESLVSSLW